MGAFLCAPLCNFQSQNIIPGIPNLLNPLGGMREALGINIWVHDI